MSRILRRAVMNTRISANKTSRPQVNSVDVAGSTDSDWSDIGISTPSDQTLDKADTTDTVLEVANDDRSENVIVHSYPAVNLGGTGPAYLEWARTEWTCSHGCDKPNPSGTLVCETCDAVRSPEPFVKSSPGQCNNCASMFINEEGICASCGKKVSVALWECDQCTLYNDSAYCWMCNKHFLSKEPVTGDWSSSRSSPFPPEPPSGFIAKPCKYGSGDGGEQDDSGKWLCGCCGLENPADQETCWLCFYPPNRQLLNESLQKRISKSMPVKRAGKSTRDRSKQIIPVRSKQQEAQQIHEVEDETQRREKLWSAYMAVRNKQRPVPAEVNPLPDILKSIPESVDKIDSLHVGRGLNISTSHDAKAVKTPGASVEQIVVSTTTRPSLTMATAENLLKADRFGLTSTSKGSAVVDSGFAWTCPRCRHKTAVFKGECPNCSSSS